MKKVLIMFALWPFAVTLAGAQVQVGNTGIQYATSAPTGACNASSAVLTVVRPVGAVYACQNGTWAFAGGGSPPPVLPYGDSFTRANGPLGANWAEPDGADGTLQIISNQVLAAAVGSGIVHSAELYVPGTFGNNQYSTITLNSGTGSAVSGSAGQFSLVRGKTSSVQFYNDAVATGATFGGLVFRVGNPASVDFCGTAWVGPPYAIGDTHELDVAGTGPVFFWSRHNGVIDATCVDSTFNYTGGNPGLGVIDTNATPTLADGPWLGGTLPDFSTTPSDNFQRANAGWLGVNWWFAMTGGGGPFTSYFVLNGNAATLSSAAGNVAGVAIWTTPFTVNHSSKITVGNIASGSDWLGAVARYSIPANGTGNEGTDTFYFALAEANGTIDLFAFSAGTYNLLSNGTFGSAISTLELDATGTSPVLLTIKVNGAQFGSTISDSTYKYTGTYAGFAAFGSQASTITGWSGANI
jgi:hypothetical protein